MKKNFLRDKWFHITCPEYAKYVNNFYGIPATGGEEISSSEGTTQGDPIAMGMYALWILPLLHLEIPSDGSKNDRIY